MSCSDKVLSWTQVGLQGALLSEFIDEAVSLASITVEVDQPDESSLSVLKRGLTLKGRLANTHTTCESEDHDGIEVYAVGRGFRDSRGKISGASLLWSVHEASVQAIAGITGIR
mmetsp:Transcript_6673/g.7969  ORF Transcript_6673/g.7969 Transcript_6673/m.7969 type:complete len:114 (+) Transcript_6673:715-1056(+)